MELPKIGIIAYVLFFTKDIIGIFSLDTTKEKYYFYGINPKTSVDFAAYLNGSVKSIGPTSYIYCLIDCSNNPNCFFRLTIQKVHSVISSIRA